MTNKLLQKGKIITIIAVTLLQFIAIQPVANAKLHINTSCFTEWDTFISSTISISDFTEYWKDIFVRYNQNTCYYMDINFVLKQIDGVRSQLRVAILGCQDKQVAKLEERYYQLEVQLDYLRNFISFADSKGKLISEAKLYNQLKKKYVDNKKVFTKEEDFKNLFDKYKLKYKNKLHSVYTKCEDASIGKLINKWDKLVATIKGMGADAKSIKDDFKDAINIPPSGMRKFIDNLKKQKNDFRTRIKTMQEEFKEYSKKNGNEPTIDSLQMSMSKTNQEYNNSLQQASLTAKYEALYKYGGDSLTNNYEKLLTTLNKTIEDSYKPLDSLKKCAKKSAKKQCK